MGKYVSDIQTNMKEFKHQLRAFIIIALPALFIIPQPDPGSALIYAAFVFPLYREGLNYIFLLLAFFVAILFVGTLLLGISWIAGIVIVCASILFIYKKRIKKRTSPFPYLIATVVAIVFTLSVNYVFENVFEQRHRDRFNIVLGKEIDAKGIGYNTNQSEIAIGSGGWTGKGWLQGTQTKGNFVPCRYKWGNCRYTNKVKTQ